MANKLAVSALGGLGLLAAVHFGWAQAASSEIAIRNFAFAPATSSVRTGSTVTFKNNDSVTHSIVASDGSFRTMDIVPGSSAQVTLKTPGTFKYFCSSHPFMEGQISVAGHPTAGLATNGR